MTELRNRMDEAMVLRGFSLRTRESYLACVRALAKHYRQPPDVLDGPRIRAYLLHLITERKLAYASVNQASCAFRFLFGTVLRQPEVRLDIPMAKVPKRLPQILSREEVSRLIEAAATLRGRTLLTTTYAAGLRVSEVCALQLADIESAPDRMCLKVRQGKGGQDRYTLLSPRLLDTLRRYWRDSIGRASGCFPTVRAPRRSSSKRRNGSTAPRATPLASPQKAAFTACVTLSPLT
jgi:site-specific recombinase XerD